MKIYIDFSKQAITKIDSDIAYVGDVYSNVFELLFFNYGVATDWFPTMSQLAPNGREAGDFSADALGENETYNYVEDGVTYKRYKFTIGDGWVRMKGRSNFFIWVNKLVDSSASLQRKCYGKLNVALNESTDNYFIQDPYFNPKIKKYINDKIDALNGLEPSGVATSTTILAYTEDKGVWVGSDTGHWYYWNGTQYADGGVYQAPFYNSSNKLNADYVDDTNSTHKFVTAEQRTQIGTNATNIANNTIAIANRYTKTEVDTALNLKADKSTTYTKTEVDTALNLKADKATTYTKTEVDNKIADISAYSKSEIDTMLNAKADASDVSALDLEVDGLANDITDLKAVQNVVDVVATKSALDSYATTKLETNDKIQVIADETHGGASTIYNWTGSAWSYVGAFGGNAYTKTQVDTLLSAKANQSTTYTKTEVDTALSAKADLSNSLQTIFAYSVTAQSVLSAKVGLTVGTAFSTAGYLGIVKDENSDKYQLFRYKSGTTTKIDIPEATGIMALTSDIESAIKDLRWELGNHTLDVSNDDDTAYEKQVPNNAIGCQINKLGGMSYKNENLVWLPDTAETTINGITYKVENGVITLNGTATSSFAITFDLYTDIPSGTYYSNFFTDNNALNFDLYFNNTSINVSDLSQQPLSFNTSVHNMLIYIASGRIYNNYVFKPMLVSGSTAPTTYKPYFDGIRDSAVTSVVSKGSNNTTIDTRTIPTEIQALTGYGWGINDTCYNYIDFDRKVFVQKVDRVVLNGSEAWYKNDAWSSENNIAMYTNISGAIYNSLNVVVDKDFTVIVNSTQSTTIDQLRIATNVVYLNFTSGGGKIDEFTLAKAKEWLSNNNLTLYFELATPVETDISTYLDGDTIEVESGGTITFTNTYSQDVPSDLDYLIEEVKA